MKDLKQFNIPFVGLKEGNHTFNYLIDSKFFEVYNYNEFSKSDINVTLDFVKKSTLIELNFTAKGSINLPCDITNESFDQEIQATLPLIVQFGPEFNDDNEEILILPPEAYQVNVAQYIYEMIVLAVPVKRIHPDVLNGTIHSDTLKKLEELEINKEKTVEEPTDPRWDKLKDLLTEKKT